MKKAIIYGGAGFIGSALVKQLAQKGTDVIVIEKPGIQKQKRYERICNIPHQLVECDLLEKQARQELLQYPTLDGADVFYQFAWDGLGRDSLSDYQKQMQNVMAVLDTVEIAGRLHCKRFVGAGSFTERELCTETGRAFQRDRHKFYRAAQFTCETMGKSIAEEAKIDFFWPQIINIYGPGEESERLIHTLLKSFYRCEPIPLSAGEQFYDFLYLTDAARAFELIGERGDAQREYRIGSGSPQPLKLYFEQMQRELAPKLPLRLGEIPYSGLMYKYEDLADTRLAELGFVPEVGFLDGVKRTYEAMLKTMKD